MGWGFFFESAYVVMHKKVYLSIIFFMYGLQFGIVLFFASLFFLWRKKFEWSCLGLLACLTICKLVVVWFLSVPLILDNLLEARSFRQLLSFANFKNFTGSDMSSAFEAFSSVFVEVISRVNSVLYQEPIIKHNSNVNKKFCNIFSYF